MASIVVTMRWLICCSSFWYASYTGQNAVPSASVRLRFSATTSFLSALIFWRRMSMLAVPAVPEVWAIAGAARATAIVNAVINLSRVIIQVSQVS